MNTEPARTDRPGDERLAFDPALEAHDAQLMFIGRVRSPWADRQQTPRNMRLAREADGHARLEIDEPFRPGLKRLAGISHILVLAWLNEARRDLIRQQPKHAPGIVGTFTLRSPARPNPVSVSIAGLLGVDEARGILELDAIDLLDKTPLIDIKPYLPSADAVIDANPGWHGTPED
jgi:tRNA-Thr(GGU) m(6)t(6)A37 methyltransferase TsaA